MGLLRPWRLGRRFWVTCARRTRSARLAQLRKWDAASRKRARAGPEDLRQAEAMYVMAADGDLAAIDWDALERVLAEVRKRLRPSPELPATLPPAWEETRARAETLGRRSQVLRGAHEERRGGAGGGRDTQRCRPMQPQAPTRSSWRCSLASCRKRPAMRPWWHADGWPRQPAALNRGELASAEASLALAQSYVAAAPQVIPEIRRIERQMASLDADSRRHS